MYIEIITQGTDKGNSVDIKLRKLVVKTVIFILSLSFAWWTVKSSNLHGLVESILPLRFVAEIVAGILYSSFLTSPVSVAMLIVLAQDNNPILTALLAGGGAVLTDLIILKFFRKELSSDLNLVSKELHLQKINRLLKRFHLDFAVPFLGAVIVASPLPDELGLMMLGASRLNYRYLIVLTYVLNTTGILFITIPANLLL